MSKTSKIERHINLIALLLNTRRPLTVSEIRVKIPAYAAQTEDTFHRTFERDKAELREQGLVIDTEDTDVFGGEIGYRIEERDALLDDPGLTPAEMAALSLAMQSWGGTARDDATLGLLKLSAVSGGGDVGPTGWMLPRVDLDGSVATLMDALSRRKRVTFSYRTGGAGESHERTVEPHGLYHRGAWYLVGHDSRRDEVRRFKLARFEGRVSVSAGKEPDFDPPPKADLDVPRGPWEGEVTDLARVAFAPEAAWWVERRTGATRVREREDGWVEMELPVADHDAFVSWLAGFAHHVEAIEPSAVREALIARLQRLGSDA